MFHLIQSNDTRQLVQHLLGFYQKKQSIFSPFLVIVPSMVLGDWLRGEIAKQSGISTLFVAEFWGKYQWQMMGEVLRLDEKVHPHDALTVPEVAVLSGSIMRWRLFAFFSEKYQPLDIDKLKDDPLAFLLTPLIEYEGNVPTISEQRLWQICQELSNVYVRYLTHRPTWLLDWAMNKSLQNTIKKMMANKAKFDEQFIVVRPEFEEGAEMTAKEKPVPEPMPEWLQEHYLNLEKALHILWCELFGQTYLYRHELEERFWQVLSGERGQELAEQAKKQLKTLHLFTVQQIPQVELDFLKKLSQYCEVYLLHFNPSAMFWADIVDKQWLEHQRIINREHVYLKDYGHGLLSRLGKESRETFAMLVDMAGMAEQGNTWQDDFITPTPPNLLNNIKTDILMLQKSNMVVEFTKSLGEDELVQKIRPKTTLSFDEHASLSLHACHSLKRQLELARLYIAQYLNTPKANGDLPILSDVVILLPDVADSEDLIRAVFPDGYGMDGLMLPIKITGTPDKNIANLLDAMLGFYELLGKPTSRFYAKEVYEWLLTPALYEAFGLTFEQMSRACELLEKAGFKRGFDERHLAKTLDGGDTDYRYTFSYALDRVVLGLISPNAPDAQTAYDTLHPFVWQPHAFAEKVLPLAGVQLADEPIITALTVIHEALDRHRDDWMRVEKVETILDDFEQCIINRYFGKFAQTVEMRAIFNTKNTMMASLRANKYHYRQVRRGGRGEPMALYDIRLTHDFVLQSLSDTTKSQAVSAEPSSVITIAKFGAVRSIPFGLTIMLGMNLSSFPRQDKTVRLDLMRAGLKRRGDRYNEDDDNGAFLDALLCADKVMIFYNGVSPDGKNELLPASPVSELVSFLTQEALWQERTELGELNILMPKLIKEYLITHHTATPFDRQNFYQTNPNQESYGSLQAIKDVINTLKHAQQCQLPPPPLWQSVREILLSQYQATDKVVLLSEAQRVFWMEVFAKTLLLAQHYKKSQNDDNVQALYHHVSGFGAIYDGKLTLLVRPLHDVLGAFLSTKIGTNATHDMDDIDEPLTLNALETYQVHEVFLQVMATGALDGSNDEVMNQAIEALYYDDILPAGVMRMLTPDEVWQDVAKQLQDFARHLDVAKERLGVEFHIETLAQYITPLAQTQVDVGVGGMTWGRLSDELPKTPLWLSVRATKASPKHLLTFWVRHLLWQIADDDVKAEQKMSIWHFKHPSNVLVNTRFEGKRTFALLPMDKVQATAYLSNLLMFAQVIRDNPIIATLESAFVWVLRGKDENFNAKTAFASWLEKAENHDDWQFVLGSHEPLPTLLAHLPMMEVLLSPLFDDLIGVE